MTLKLPDNKDEALEAAQYAVEGLNLIFQLVSGAGSSTAAGVVTIIRVVLSSIREGFEGKLTAEQVHKELAKLRANLSSNDAAADAALAKKFDNSDQGPEDR